MIVAGVMSGTSADGINVALIQVGAKARGFEFIGNSEYAYPQNVRRFILAAMNASQAKVSDLARLNFLLGKLYAGAVLRTEKRFRRKAELIGCHGQTLYHQGDAVKFLGHKLAVTWQTGEGAILAARTGVPVVSDFRPADMAAGGQGAPLVPYLDFLLYRDRRVGRIVQNIGGIANLTAIPAKASAKDVIAFDTGPGNMVIDALMERFFRLAYDRDGRTAGSGEVLEAVLSDLLREPFFRQSPPKTAGREQFGREFVERLLRRSKGASRRQVVATATALTAISIGKALRRFVLTKEGRYRDFIVSGGGAKNRTLMKWLSAELQPLGLRLRSSDDFGLPSEAKEAAAFALLAYETWHRRPSNLPPATGAKKPAILGKISYA